MSSDERKDQRVPVLMGKTLKDWGHRYAKRQGESLSELIRAHLEDLRAKDISEGKIDVEVFDVR